MCVSLPIADKSDLLNAVLKWLGIYGKACFSPNDDYDYEPQETYFDNSISRLILDLKGDTLSTDWKISELKTIIAKIFADGSVATPKASAANVSQIEFFSENGENKLRIMPKNGREVLLKTAACTYLN